MEGTETFYNVHKAITIAKDSIGVQNIKEALKQSMQQLGYGVIIDKNTGVVFKAPDLNNAQNIYSHIYQFMAQYFESNKYSMIPELRNAGFPDGCESLILSNIVHTYFIIPMAPYGVYEIKL